jgi:PBP1b-binding outer membrane lipoprotein LpoB
MKKVFLISLLALFLVSCGVNSHLSYNQNNQQTNVVLSENNYKVVAKVKGEATATYILGFGGLKNRALVEMAKANMLDKADILGKARAIINVTAEEHYTGIIPPIYVKRRVIVSAHVIEFNEKEEK